MHISQHCSECNCAWHERTLHGKSTMSFQLVCVVNLGSIIREKVNAAPLWTELVHDRHASRLKLVLSPNIPFMMVTLDVFHVLMG